MSQQALPSGDINAGTWTTAPLYTSIDEVSPNDADFITSQKNAGASECEVSLSPISDPEVHTDHIINYRAKCDKASNGTIIVSLIQGSTVIRSYDPGYLGTSFAPYSFTLTAEEAANITNYADLRLRLSGSCTANAYVFLSWAELQVPDAAAVVPNLVKMVISNMG